MANVYGPRARVLIRAVWAPLLLAAAALSACAPAGGAARGPYPAFSEYEGHQVRTLRFLGELELPADSLENVIVTRQSRCWFVFLPVCLFGLGRDPYELDLDELASDVVRLQLYYRDHGYYGSRIVPSVDPVGEEAVAVRFAIAPGDQVILQELTVEGTDTILEAAQVEAVVPLEVGEPFRRIGFLRSADTIRTELLRRGHAYAEVLRNYSIDTIANVAEAQFVAIPGPPVHVDTILFVGRDRLSERTLRKQITLDEGELLRLPDLNASQRNLYALQMVGFASLEIAPDSLQLDADSTRATVLARIVEAPQYVVDAAAGIGTVECLRTETRFHDRNFLGGGRSLELIGRLSRIGVGEPLDLGLQNGLCAGVEDNVFGDRDFSRFLNYRVAANFLQPRLLATRTELGLNLHWERLNELDAYLRESAGGQVTLGREIGANKLLNTSLTIQRGRTLANPVVFCVGFDICTGEDIERLEDQRWSNSLSVSSVWDRTQTEGFISRGFIVRGAVDWASSLLGSDNRYLRLYGEGAHFRQLRPGVVVATNLRLGTFLSGGLGLEDGYIPPERRFYAGGPNSVRGYPPNALGPTAYLLEPDDELEDAKRSAIGGTSLVVASAEVRAPSPFYSDFFRLAAFLDAGQVWAPGEAFNALGLRFTPGAGLRIITPVGPVRLDVAYNGYRYEGGAAYRIDPSTGGIQVEEDFFQPDFGSFWRRLQFSFAVGQAF